MNIADIIAPERVAIAERVHSKKRALEQLAGLLSTGAPYVTAGEIFTALVAREKLGSTGIGAGVAIPHARMQGIDECVAGFIRLPQALDFDANDEQPVDLVFGVLVPEQSTQAHLDLLQVLSEMFSYTQSVSELRAATDNKQLFDTLARCASATPASAH